VPKSSGAAALKAAAGVGGGKPGDQGENSEKLQCPECLLTRFRTKFALYQHMEAKHDWTPAQCRNLLGSDGKTVPAEKTSDVDENIRRRQLLEEVRQQRPMAVSPRAPVGGREGTALGTSSIVMDANMSVDVAARAASSAASHGAMICEAELLTSGMVVASVAEVMAHNTTFSVREVYTVARRLNPTVQFTEVSYTLSYMFLRTVHTDIGIFSGWPLRFCEQ
jgi:hypothetical protein